MAKEAQTKKKLDGYLWGFTRQQQEKIKAFADISEVVEIYKTDKLNCEIRLRIAKKKTLKSVWITVDGDDYEQNIYNTLGLTIDESKLTLTEYKEKFPFENADFAPLVVPQTSIGNIDFDFDPFETAVDKLNRVEVLKVLKKENGLTEKEIAERAGLTLDTVRTVALKMDDPNAEYSIDVNDKKEYFLCQNGAIYVTPTTKQYKYNVEIVGVPEKSEYQFADVSRIKPSPTNPRRRFDEVSLDELAANIEENGLINPITVRRALISEIDKYDYEIVAGERRWRASQRTSHKMIPVIVKNLTDEQVLEIQIHENLHREEVHPLDEAFAYEHLMKTLNITQEELALRVGKPEKFVRTRLKLNQLIPVAQEDLEANRITIKMALEIAKFDPQIQLKVLNCAYTQKWQNGEYVPVKEHRQTFGNFLDKVREKVLLELSSAKFDLTDTTLRKDCLACINCPERTGAKDSLFDELKDDADQCLNAACFNEKNNQHIRNLYERANAEEIKNGADANYKMRIIAWYSSSQGNLKKIFGRDVLVDGDYKSVSKGCKNIEKGIYLDSVDRFGKIIILCANKSCKAHWSSSSSSSSNSNKGKDENEARKERLERKQYLLDVRVGEPARVEVLKLAAREFGERHPGNLARYYPIGDYFDEAIFRWFYLQNSHEEMTAKVISGIIEEWCGDVPKVGSYGFDLDEWENFLKNQREEILAAIYFLLVNGHKCQMLYETKRDQSEIVAIAEKFNINYELVYAQQLVKKCAEDKQYKKFLDAAKLYLQAVERGEKIARPIFFKVD